MCQRVCAVKRESGMVGVDVVREVEGGLRREVQEGQVVLVYRHSVSSSKRERKVEVGKREGWCERGCLGIG